VVTPGKRVLPLATAASVVVALCLALLGNILTNGQGGTPAFLGFLVLAVAQVTLTVRLDRRDHTLSWTPSLVIPAVVAGATVILGSIAQLGAAYQAEDSRLVTLICWTLAAVSATSAAVVGLGMTGASRSGAIALVLSSALTLTVAVPAYYMLLQYRPLSVGGKYQPSPAVQACSEEVRILRDRYEAEVDGQGGSEVPGVGPGAEGLRIQLERAEARCDDLRRQDTATLSALEAAVSSNAGSRLPLFTIVQLVLLAVVALTLALALASGRTLVLTRAATEHRVADVPRRPERPERAASPAETAVDVLRPEQDAGNIAGANMEAGTRPRAE
jgi:hypothetical protein